MADAGLLREPGESMTCVSKCAPQGVVFHPHITTDAVDSFEFLYVVFGLSLQRRAGRLARQVNVTLAAFRPPAFVR